MIEQKIYAGVLGKIFGVYSGRPIEAWSYEKIMEHYGELWGYVPNTKNLVVTDDDITGTFTFIRALEDNPNKQITSEDIGNCWMNYIIENKSILWWGGYGMSTEHTAYINMKNGIKAPMSGSTQINGSVISEQIGAQIFIDSWAFITPNDPDLCAKLAREAAMVSHDGEAVNAAIVIAVIESLAFSITNIEELMNRALSYIPKDCTIAKLIKDLLVLRKTEENWHKARLWLEQNYGYDKYPGNCHVVPNHGIVILSLLWGNDSFDKSLMIANTSGWDTDCNAANVGAILGIKKGLEAFSESIDWRTPISDQLYLSNSDGIVSDAVQITDYLIKLHSMLYKKNYIHPNNNYLYHFSYPGSTQGFKQEETPFDSYKVNIKNKDKALECSIECPNTVESNAYFSTLTYIPPAQQEKQWYEFIVSPTIYSGQKLIARFFSKKLEYDPISITAYILIYNSKNEIEIIEGTSIILNEDDNQILNWVIPELKGLPIFKVGFKVSCKGKNSIYLDYLTWTGNPKEKFINHQSSMCTNAWVSSCDNIHNWHDGFELVKNFGSGIATQGSHYHKYYTIESELSLAQSKKCGIIGHVQGLERYYSFCISKNCVTLSCNFDNTTSVLCEKHMEFDPNKFYQLQCVFSESSIQCFIDNSLIFIYKNDLYLKHGRFGVLVADGCMTMNYYSVE